MSQRLFVIVNEEVRQRAMDFLRMLPIGYRVLFQEPKRTLDQNAKLWASLGDISDQVMWHGQKLSSADWKLIFLSGLNQEMRMVPNINNNGFVDLGRSSSKLSKKEMADLITLIEAFGDERGVKFNDKVVIE